MAVLQVIGSGQGVGKTSLISALLLGLLEEGKRPGYYKPFSPSPGEDGDLSFIHQTLLAGATPPNPPQAFPSEAAGGGATLTGQLAEEVRATVETLAEDADVLLVEGPDLPLLQASGRDLIRQVTGAPGTRVLLMFGYVPELQASSIIQAAQDFQGRLAGVVINGYVRYRNRQVAEELVEELRSGGVQVLGAMPEDRDMLSVTVPQIADYLGGRWLQGPKDNDAWVDRFLIGGNVMDSGPNYFGRYSNQAVITRAERPDIQLASLMCDTKCLVLTGGAEPTEYIKAEASKREVPILLVAEDTLTTAESLGGLLDASGPHSLYKARHFARRIGEHLDLAALNSALA